MTIVRSRFVPRRFHRPTPPQGTQPLEFVGVRKTCPNGVRAIHGIDMSVADGEFVVVVGPSGCGKSTLLRMVAGLETVTEGEIRIDARRVNELEPADREAAALEIAVELVEALGADSLVHGQLAGGGQGAAVTVRVDGARQVAAREVVPRAVAPEHAHLFDAGSAKRLAGARGCWK